MIFTLFLMYSGKKSTTTFILKAFDSIFEEYQQFLKLQMVVFTQFGQVFNLQSVTKIYYMRVVKRNRKK